MNKLIKDAMFGVAGGIAGTAVLGQVMRAMSRVQSQKDKKQEQRLVREQPTEKVAQGVSRKLFGVQLSRDKKATMGKVVHWGYGAFWGGIYGILRNRIPFVRRTAALPFGIGFGLFGPAAMLPLLRLTPSATRFPLSAHVRGLVSHYAYAATAEGVCLLCEKIDEKVAGTPPRTNSELRRVS